MVLLGDDLEPIVFHIIQRESQLPSRLTLSHKNLIGHIGRCLRHNRQLRSRHGFQMLLKFIGRRLHARRRLRREDNFRHGLSPGNQWDLRAKGKCCGEEGDQGDELIHKEGLVI